MQLTDNVFSNANKPLQINYRNYKYLNEYSFNEDLKLAFSNTDIQTCEAFEELLTANNAPQLTKKT